ncbi:MAG: hypothetical protein K2Y37_23510 [Pirellulales bacterium]|nr:hypothetical protein [Pirellulales bacterium]
MHQKPFELWRSRRQQDWDQALRAYWDTVPARSMEIERAMDNLSLSRISQMDESDWFLFLRDEYFYWKFMVRKRNTNYLEKQSRAELFEIKRELLDMRFSDDDRDGIRRAIRAADKVAGLDVKSATGLLAVMYPKWFGTVDRHVIDCLQTISELPEFDAIQEMSARKNVTVDDATLLVLVMRTALSEKSSVTGIP